MHCVFVYYHAFFFFFFFYEQYGLTVNNGLYFHCSGTEYTTRTTRILFVQSSHKDPDQNMHMYGFDTISN